MNVQKILVTSALLLSPALALAHPGHDHAGVVSGIAHPIFGLDHLLAMLAVGLWAAQQTGKARWALPLTFVATMLFGGLAGFAGIENALFYADNTRMLYGDGADMANALVTELKALDGGH